jgi:hypothetical protein
MRSSAAESSGDPPTPVQFWPQFGRLQPRDARLSVCRGTLPARDSVGSGGNVREFSFYDFAGVIAPGALLLFGTTYLLPGVGDLCALMQMELGGLGVFALLAYVAGHLAQAVGNLFESAYWKAWGGMPSVWVLRGELLGATQLDRLAAVVRERLAIPSLRDSTAPAWLAATREIYAGIAAAGRAARVDTFNGNYGMMRGTAAAALALAVLALATRGLAAWRVEVALVVVAVVAAYRMHRFAVHYSRELLVQYLELTRPPARPSAS